MTKWAPAIRCGVLPGAMGLLAVALTGCSRSVGEPVRIGINAWPGYEFLYLAAERGILSRHGLNIEIKEYSSLGDTRRAFERGQIDGMASTLVEVLQAAGQSGRRPRIVMVADQSIGGDVILAKPGIGSVAELRGKVVAAETSSLGAYIIWRAAGMAGMNTKAFRMRPMDQLEMESAALYGAVDAVITYPPFSMSIERLGWKPIFDSRQLPGEIVDVVSVDASTLERIPDFQTRLIGAWGEALDYFRNQRSEAVKIMAARERLMPAEFETALASVEMLEVGSMRVYLQPAGRLCAILRRVETALREAGELTGPDHSSGVTALLPAEDRAGVQ